VSTLTITGGCCPPHSAHMVVVPGAAVRLAMARLIDGSDATSPPPASPAEPTTTPTIRLLRKVGQLQSVETGPTWRTLESHRSRVHGPRLGQVPRSAPGAVVVAEWGAVFVLVSIGFFWTVGSYAIGAGIDRAHEFEVSLPSRSDVVAYSEKRLSLQAPGVREVICQYPDAAYRFRYDGLKLVQQSGNQYLLLPAGWTRAHGTAILIPRSEAVRLEFSAAGQVRNATC
jgi:hypothetical protein